MCIIWLWYCVATRINDYVMQHNMTMIRANFWRLECKQSAIDTILYFAKSYITWKQFFIFWLLLDDHRIKFIHIFRKWTMGGVCGITICWQKGDSGLFLLSFFKKTGTIHNLTELIIWNTSKKKVHYIHFVWYQKNHKMVVSNGKMTANGDKKWIRVWGIFDIILFIFCIFTHKPSQARVHANIYKMLFLFDTFYLHHKKFQLHQ